MRRRDPRGHCGAMCRMPPVFPRADRAKIGTRMLKAGNTVHLPCAAGVNRSPIVAAAYLHWCLAWPLERALAREGEVRDCSPNAEAARGARRSRIERRLQKILCR